ncbi:hypothetical protein LCGC14_3025720 [marine sediment metagenome]|uniref:Uncharacterized protein n=1 Tax=marine sediment metagenome TaxID=412755 RepID=A0A0F8WU92_9ZZZZ
METKDINHTPTRNIIIKVEKMSLRFHKMSLLFNELANSLKQEWKRGKSFKEIKETLKGIDFDKLSHEIKFSDFKK